MPAKEAFKHAWRAVTRDQEVLDAAVRLLLALANVMARTITRTPSRE